MDFRPFFDLEPAIQIHIAAALFSFFSGLVLFGKRKGTRFHRNTGKLWVVAMATVAISGFFIHEIRMWGDFSPIHLFSVITLWSLGHAIWMVRKGNIVAHEQTMKGLYLGGMIFAGGLALARNLTLIKGLFPALLGGSVAPIDNIPGGGIALTFVGAGLIFVWLFWRGMRSPFAKQKRADLNSN